MNTAGSVRQAPSAPEWFASWFDSAHYHRLYAYRDQTEAVRLIDQLIARGHLAAGGAVLDLGCGSGRHSRYLASKGFDVTGLDLSAESLKQARLGEGPRLRFVRQDMREPFGGRRVRSRREPVHELRLLRGHGRQHLGRAQHRDARSSQAAASCSTT